MKEDRKNKSQLLLVGGFLTLGIFTSATAETLQVPREHPTIQAAIEAAKAGDTVLVSPGTYKERIHLSRG